MNKALRTRLWNLIYDLLDDPPYLELIWRDFLMQNADALDYGDIDLHIHWTIQKTWNLLEADIMNRRNGGWFGGLHRIYILKS